MKFWYLLQKQQGKAQISMHNVFVNQSLLAHIHISVDTCRAEQDKSSDLNLEIPCWTSVHTYLKCDTLPLSC